MKTKVLIVATFGLFSSVLSSPAPQIAVGFTSANAPSPFLQCGAVGAGCHMEMSMNSKAPYQPRWSCSCDDNPLGKPDLSWFYTEENYYGYEYRCYGDYGTCQNLPEAYDKKAKSFASNLPGKQPIICCIYTTWDCDEKVPWVQVTGTNNDGAIPKLQAPFRRKVSSYRCAKWVDEQSDCKGSQPNQQ